MGAVKSPIRRRDSLTQRPQISTSCVSLATWWRTLRNTRLPRHQTEQTPGKVSPLWIYSWPPSSTIAIGKLPVSRPTMLHACSNQGWLAGNVQAENTEAEESHIQRLLQICDQSVLRYDLALRHLKASLIYSKGILSERVQPLLLLDLFGRRSWRCLGFYTELWLPSCMFGCTNGGYGTGLDFEAGLIRAVKEPSVIDSQLSEGVLVAALLR